MLGWFRISVSGVHDAQFLLLHKVVNILDMVLLKLIDVDDIYDD